MTRTPFQLWLARHPRCWYAVLALATPVLIVEAYYDGRSFAAFGAQRSKHAGGVHEVNLMRAAIKQAWREGPNT